MSTLVDQCKPMVMLLGMTENPNMPHKGSIARRIYDAIKRSSEGLTAFEVERACGVIKNQPTHMAKLADKQLIMVVGKRDFEGMKNLEIWGIKREQTTAKKEKKRRRLGSVPKQEHNSYECPACGKTIYLLLQYPEHGNACVEVNIQRRLVIFDGPWVKNEYTDADTGEERIALTPKEPLALFEEWTGKLVVGRTATESEKEYYAEHHKIRKPWTIGFEGHLSTCKGWKRWLNGKAQEKRRTQETKWDNTKKRFGLFKREAKKTIMTDAFTDALPEEEETEDKGKSKD